MKIKIIKTYLSTIIISKGLDSNRNVTILRKDTTFFILQNMFQQFDCHLQLQLTQSTKLNL